MAKQTEAQKRAEQKYRQNIKSYLVRLHKEKDADIIEYISTLDNKEVFIRNAIRQAIKDADMQKTKK